MSPGFQRFRSYFPVHVPTQIPAQQRCRDSKFVAFLSLNTSLRTIAVNTPSALPRLSDNAANPLIEDLEGTKNKDSRMRCNAFQYMRSNSKELSRLVIKHDEYNYSMAAETETTKSL